MSDQYLIAHKVRGQPAFDVATRMQCPICEGDRNLSNGIIDITGDDGMVPCYECDGLGYWWIIPTSGHRAYPWWSIELHQTYVLDLAASHWNNSTTLCGPMPPNLPDHYPINAAPGFDLATVLGLHEAKSAKPFPRRI